MFTNKNNVLQIELNHGGKVHFVPIRFQEKSGVVPARVFQSNRPQRTRQVPALAGVSKGDAVNFPCHAGK
jgi:hypothetical protein